jgi:hypothetical protein
VIDKDGNGLWNFDLQFLNQMKRKKTTKIFTTTSTRCVGVNKNNLEYIICSKEAQVKSLLESLKTLNWPNKDLVPFDFTLSHIKDLIG